VAAGGLPDPKAAHRAIGEVFFPKPGNEKNQTTSGMNAFLSMRHYGLITEKDKYSLTEVAEQLLATLSDEEMIDAFARHILLDLNGLQLVEVVTSLTARGISLNAEKVGEELSAIGIDPGGSSGENVNPMRLWLERAGVFTGTWSVDSSAVRRLIGASPEEVSELASLPEDQQALLRALATISDPPPLLGNKVRELAELQTPWVSISLKNLAATLELLQKLGWVTLTKVTGGRGAKPHQVTPTQRFAEVISEPLMTAFLEQVHPLDPASLRRPLTDLLSVVDDKSQSNHERGLAMEGVCLQVIRLLGARFVGWRLRGAQTSGAEVDVVAEISLPYLLAQVQSKASDINGRDRIDREVGVASTLKSNMILFVASGKVGPAAHRAADVHMQETGLAILFLQGSDFTDGSASITTAMRKQWDHVRDVRSAVARARTSAVGS